MTNADGKRRNPVGWPQDLSFAAFGQALPVSKSTVYRYFFNTFADRIKVRNPELAIPKLKKILQATFKISSRKGFHAMSLRNLCQETDMSMGGMYNYFGSKEELSHMINHFVGTTLDDICYPLLPEIDDIEARMEAMIRLLIYNGEMFQPWYYFVYMEARSIPKLQREAAKRHEQRTVNAIHELVEMGNTAGLFHVSNSSLTASSILSLTQNWYVKPWYFKTTAISVHEYADFVVDSARTLLNPP